MSFPLPESVVLYWHHPLSGLQEFIRCGLCRLCLIIHEFSMDSTGAGTAAPGSRIYMFDSRTRLSTIVRENVS
ncbi:hypothetical protein Y1Q_0006032 [Alligator mississippiensis]|uniref:Uncharacterized protein n=1 Tax=Alligator mississippiensis TaxID=8496 RepID=A0A151N492_ALLMI|nr:hypothetical protein Y1Q_0006032 [Alligator mississippiensis]